MSLNFVSSAVLTSTDGVSHNDEKSIESKEVQALRNQQQHKPLFEQLRSNKEEEEAAKEELERSIMRGTCALDEEDCAHLDAVQRERQKREQAVKNSVDEELALFRAARADRAQADVVIDDDDDEKQDKGEEKVSDAKVASSETTKPAPLVPVILKRRRRQPAGDSEQSTKKTKTGETSIKGKDFSASQTKTTSTDTAGGLSGLLGGYGSSDEDSDSD